MLMFREDVGNEFQQYWTCKHSHAKTLAASTKLSCDPTRVPSATAKDRHLVIGEASEKLEVLRASWIYSRFSLIWNTRMELLVLYDSWDW